MSFRAELNHSPANDSTKSRNLFLFCGKGKDGTRPAAVSFPSTGGIGVSTYTLGGFFASFASFAVYECKLTAKVAKFAKKNPSSPP